MKHNDYSARPYQPEYDYDVNQPMFNPLDFIKPLDDGFALCHNPMGGGGLSAITVNTRLHGEALKNFEGSVKRMVLSKLFSPKFGEVILAATRIGSAH